MKYTADFETATWYEDKTYVWAWAVCEIGNEDNITYGSTIDEFLNFCEKEKNATLYFHNLKFDRRIYHFKTIRFTALSTYKIKKI